MIPPRTMWRRPRLTLGVGVAAATLLGTAVVAMPPAQAATSFSVTYTVTATWGGGFVANVDLKNTGDPVSNWTVAWTFPDSGQRVTSAWNASVNQSGSAVTAANVGYNGSLATGATTSFGFQGTWTSANPVPSSFTVNGASGGGGSTTTTPPTTTTTTVWQPPTTTTTTTTRPTTTTTTTTTRPTTTTTTTTRPTTTSIPPQTGVVGWATQNGGTTGGSSSNVVNVSTSSAFLSAISSSTSQTVRLTGNISLSGMNKVASNKTIIGSGTGKTISGGGLNLSGVRNVIIRNLNFTGWNDDAINMQESTTNVWVDHCSFSNGYDGALDIKRGSDFITVSWNRTFNHDKSMLLGHSDDNGGQDRGHLRVTYHHNWFDGTTQRHPRVRFGNPVHVYNNYYVNNGGYGVASTEGAGVLVESNYFERVSDPAHRGEGSSSAGNLVARNNYLTGSGPIDAGGSVASIPYGYSVDPASNVKSIVTGGAGVGHLNL